MKAFYKFIILFSLSINICQILSLATSPWVKPWPNCEVPFQIFPSHPYREKILVILNEFETKTRIKFVEKQNSHKSWININYNPLEGNYSQYLGYTGFAYNLNIKSYRIAHELGHALGFIHEHQRSDRDNWLELIDANFRPNEDHSQIKNKLETTPITNYDINSIMHYWCSAGATKLKWYEWLIFTDNYNGEHITLVYKPNRSLKFNTNEKLSQLDIEGINKFYNDCSLKIMDQ